MYFSSEEKYIFANIHLLSFGESSGRLDPIDDGNNTALLPIENMIHVIRGQQVMIDSDPAWLYGVETGSLIWRLLLFDDLFVLRNILHYLCG